MIQNTNYPHFSDHLFINVMNTLKMQNHSPIDLLSEEADVVQWVSLMNENNLLTATQVERIKEGPVNIVDLQHFRDQCRAHFASDDRNLIELLTHTTKETPLSFMMEEETMTPVPSKGGTKGLLAIMAYQMLTLEESGTLKKVKACENDDCLAFFVNQKGKRKWCSMEVCGNRTKAKKHYHTKAKTSQNT